MRAALRYLLLDFDGPICSVFAGFPAKQVARELIAYIGPDVPSGWMAGVDDPHKILRSSGELGQNIAARIHRELANLENDAVKSAKPTPYAADVIEHAKWVGAKVAVVSNNDQSAVTSYLVASGLSSVIDCVSARSSADPALMKPSPYLVNEALSALGAERASSALVGDQVSDIIAAHQANIPAIGYANRTGKVKSFADSGADAVIESMSELREFL